jgi:hypothetical protein
MSGASNHIIKERIEKMNLDFQSSKPESIIREDKDIFIEDSPVE